MAEYYNEQHHPNRRKDDRKGKSDRPHVINNHGGFNVIVLGGEAKFYQMGPEDVRELARAREEAAERWR